jgi:hypothetical protein
MTMGSGSDDSGASIRTVSIGVGLLMTWLLWGCACAMYDAGRPRPADDSLLGEDDGVAVPLRIRGRAAGLVFAVAGVATFVGKSFTMLPEVLTVTGFIVRERFWYVIVSFVVLGGVVAFAWFLKQTEAALAAPKRKRRRR